MKALNVKFENNFYRENFPVEWEQLYQLVLTHKKYFGSLFKHASQNKKHAYRKLYDWIIAQTPLLDNDTYSVGTRVYWILNGVTDFPVCAYCHSSLGYIGKNVSPYKEPYREYCSVACCNKSVEHKESCHHLLSNTAKKSIGIKHRARHYDSFIENLKKHNIILITPKDDYIENGSAQTNTYKCLKCGFEFQSAYTDFRHIFCEMCKGTSSVSIEECDFRSAIISLTNSQPIFNARILGRFEPKWQYKEIDVYFPEYKLGFEYDGIYYHSVEFGKDTQYHCAKTKLAEQLGIKLVHIRSDQWNDNKTYWLQLIQQMLNSTDIDILSYAKKKDDKVFTFDRSVFNLSWFPENLFSLLEETKPYMHVLKSKSNIFHYYDCGDLIIRRI